MIKVFTQDRGCIVDCADISIYGNTISNYGKNITTLGQYATPERAQNVLEEIWTEIRYEDCNNCFVMPEK